MRRRVLQVLFGIAVIAGSFRLGWFILESPDIALALSLGTVPVLICVWLILKGKVDRPFLFRVFAIALTLRWAVALFIHYRGLQFFFGADASTYNNVGNTLSRAWLGLISSDSLYLASYTSYNRPGWGMYYFVASVYYAVGQNQLLMQLLNCALGAASCLAVYKIARMVHPEQRVARVAAILIAVSPSMILWSSQLLKDAPIVLCLCLCALYALKLRHKIRVLDLMLLLLFLFCLFSLRHYAFYIMFVAIAGSFLLTPERFTPLRMMQAGALVIVIGVALTYFGASNVPEEAFDIKRIQASRAWGATAANSGFGGDVDISDPKAAITFLPVGLMYVLLAPFPWAINNLRQLVTLPELMVWWVLVPMLIKGYWFAIRHRLKETFAICIFTLGLTLSYALYQSNVGTAYRHRAQLYVFFAIFISMGWELRRQAKLKRRARVSIANHDLSPLPVPSGTGAFSKQTIDIRTS